MIYIVYKEVGIRPHIFPGGSDGKASVYNAGDPGLSPGLGRSLGEGNGNPLQYYYLENPMERGAWKAAVYGVTKSRTRLSDFTSTWLWQLILSYLLCGKHGDGSQNLGEVTCNSWIGKKCST